MASQSARAPGSCREPAPARRGAEFGEQCHVPTARGVDGALERGVRLQQGRAQPLLGPGARGRRELVLMCNKRWS